MLTRNYNILGIILLSGLLLTMSGCSGTSSARPEKPAGQAVTESTARRAQTIMDGFAALVQKKNVVPGELITYIEANIAAVAGPQGAVMLIGLERIQNERLPELQDKYADSEAIQRTLAGKRPGDLTDAFISGIQDKAVQETLILTKAGGFKVETAEGMFFPVIDYARYQQYRAAVSPDIAAYIDIMAVESDKTPAKDAALVISWDEIMQRALSQERFLNEYGGSTKAADVRQLLKRYLVFALFGLNNTPLFAYDTAQVTPAARNAYLAAAFDGKNGPFSQTMNEYRQALKTSDFRLTPEIDSFRRQAVAAF